MSGESPYPFVCQAVIQLRQSQAFATEYVRLKAEFFHRFQGGMVFSTRFGAEFFEEVKAFLENPKQRLQPVDGILGEFDRNFNRWLDNNHQS
jgi:hypothetical protein